MTWPDLDWPDSDPSDSMCIIIPKIANTRVSFSGSIRIKSLRIPVGSEKYKEEGTASE